MPSRRRLAIAASTALVCGSLALGGCSNGADVTDDGSSTGTPASTSSSTSATSAGSSGSESPSSESPSSDESSETTDPYAIDCTLIPKEVVNTWVRGGKTTSIKPTEQGCRVVSSSEDGAVIVEWRWLDVVGSGGDAGILRGLESAGDPITVAPGIPGTRLETDVPPTRKARVAAKIKEHMLYVESTVTLDRNQSMQDLRRVTTGIIKAYEDTAPNPHAES